jgi:hypothetical protein
MRTLSNDLNNFLIRSIGYYYHYVNNNNNKVIQFFILICFTNRKMANYRYSTNKFNSIQFILYFNVLTQQLQEPITELARV